MQPLTPRQQNLILFFENNFLGFEFKILALCSELHPQFFSALSLIAENMRITKEAVISHERLNFVAERQSNRTIENGESSLIKGTISQPCCKSQAREYLESSNAYIIDETLSKISHLNLDILDEFYHFTQNLRKISFDFNNLFLAFCQIDFLKDKLIMKINWGENPNELDIINFKEQLHKGIKKTCECIANIKSSPSFKSTIVSDLVKNFFQDRYEEAYIMQKHLILLSNWHQILCRHAELILMPNNLTKALTIKKLLSIIKNQIYLEFYQRQNPAAINYQLYKNILAALDNNITSSLKILAELNKNINEVEQQIKQWEEKLKNYSLSYSLIASGIFLGAENYYYQFSESYILLIEEITTKGALSNCFLLNTPLTPRAKKILAVTASAILITMDKYFFGITGVAYTLCLSLNKLMRPDLEKLRRLGLSDKRITLSLASFDLISNLFLYLGITGMFLGFSSEIMPFLTLNYFLAQSFRFACGVAVDKGRSYFWKRHDTQQARIAYELFIKKPIQHVVAACSQRFLTPLIYNSAHTFFKPRPTVNELLSNEEICQHHAVTCKEVALKTLGLPNNANLIQVTDTFRQLSLQYHPDKTRDIARQKQFVDISRAKAILDDLLKPRDAGETGCCLSNNN